MNDFLNIETNSNGVLSGWCDADLDGAPAKIKFYIPGCLPEALPLIYCSDERRDVKDAGMGLFVGFYVLLASDWSVECLSASINGREFSVFPNDKEIRFNLIVDSADAGQLVGWIEAPELPFSLVVSDGEVIRFAEFYDRPDIEVTKGQAWKRSGFRVYDFESRKIRWFVLNNRFLRVFKT